ncbi:hypothetical protein CHUAL_011619 [Chamberlinius hualienensis]
MSGPSGGGSRQEIQKKILEEIKQQKKQLQMKTQPQPGCLMATSTISATSTNLMMNTPDSLPGNQRAALQHAHAHSVGFFITQDSSFGNLILPVIPRVENK